MMKRNLIKWIACLTVLVLLVGTSVSCEKYKPNYEFVAIDPGELPAPKVSKDDKEAFREHYGTLTPYDKEVTISVAVVDYALESGVRPGTTYRNQAFNKIAKKYLNINLDYQVVGTPAYYDTKLNLAIAKDTLPDMFYVSQPATFVSLRDGGKLADLGDVFYYLNDELQENYLKNMPDILPTSMVDGKLYALPMQTDPSTSAQRLYIRQDWLDIVGKTAPTTIDEMIEVGKAFYEKREEIAQKTGIGNAAKIVPFTMYNELTWTGSYSAEGLFNAFGSSMGAFFDEGDGKLVASNTSQNTKDAVAAMKTMYEQHVLDPDFLSKNVEMIQANIKAGFVGMFFGEWWVPMDTMSTSVTSKSVDGADWSWVNIPSGYAGKEAKPVTSRVLLSGYNLVSKDCKHPEAIARLINLFYDVYYSDDAGSRYVDDNGQPLTLPANGFYYQFVPVKLWDGTASNKEHKRVQSVFDNLIEKGFYSSERMSAGALQEVSTSEVLPSDYSVAQNDSAGTTTILSRKLVAEINGNAEWKAEFDRLRTREKLLHFAYGYPYFSAYQQNVPLKNMTDAEKSGWGIYHEMIDENGSFAYVVDLGEGKVSSKKNEFYGSALSAMKEFNADLARQTGTTFTQIIKGEKTMADFDKFVKQYRENYQGNVVLEQVNAWYAAQPKHK